MVRHLGGRVTGGITGSPYCGNDGGGGTGSPYDGSDRPHNGTGQQNLKRRFIKKNTHRDQCQKYYSGTLGTYKSLLRDPPGGVPLPAPPPSAGLRRFGSGDKSPATLNALISHIKLTTHGWWYVG